MACDHLACIDGNCIAEFSNGTVGQALIIGAGGTPIWSASTADDQTAAEVPFTPHQSLQATNVQAAIEEIVDEFCTVLMPTCSIDSLKDVDTTTAPPGTTSLLRFDGANWVPVTAQKNVSNVGTALPIADVADAGGQFVFTNGLLSFAETSDTIPTIGADGNIRHYLRQFGARAGSSFAQPAVFQFTLTDLYATPILFDPSGSITSVSPFNYTARADGHYYFYIRCGLAVLGAGATRTIGPEEGYEVYILVNGAIQEQVGYYRNLSNTPYVQSGPTSAIPFVGDGCLVSLAQGDVVSFQATHVLGGGQSLSFSVDYISVFRVS